MNKLFKSILSLAVFSIMLGGVSYAAEPTLDSYILKRQNGGRQDVAPRVLKLVRFSSQSPNGPDVASGDALVWDTISDDGVSVRFTTTSADGAFAGIAVTAIQTSDRSAANPPTSSFDDVGRRNWGYILVSGPISAKMTNGSGGSNTVGSMFVTSSDSGAIVGVGSYSASSVADGAGLNSTRNYINGRGGFFLDSSNPTDTSVEVYVKAE